MMILLLACVIFSAAFLILLCLGDPKRRRSGRLRGTAQGTAVRRLLTVTSLLPGIFLALGGYAAAFLMWLGGYAVVGWLITLCFSTVQEMSGRPPRTIRP